MRTRNEEAFSEKKARIMCACVDCYAENGLHGTGLSAVAAAAGVSKAALYTYFEDADDLLTQSTAYVLSRVEDEFMQKAPQNPSDIVRFIDEVPYWNAERHGKKYRLMYQVFTHPKYIEHGKRFFAGVNERYTQYARELAPKLGMPHSVITPLIFIFVRACVHYALFEDDYYLRAQMTVLKETVALFIEKYKKGEAENENDLRKA